MFDQPLEEIRREAYPLGSLIQLERIVDSNAKLPLDFYTDPVEEVAGPHPSVPPGAIYPEVVKLGPFIFRFVVPGLETDEVFPWMPVKKTVYGILVFYRKIYSGNQVAEVISPTADDFFKQRQFCLDDTQRSPVAGDSVLKENKFAIVAGNL